MDFGWLLGNYPWIRRLKEDGTMSEEFAQDAPFVGHRRDRPKPSFCIDKDCFAVCFIIVRPANDNPKPFWLTRALTKSKSGAYSPYTNLILNVYFSPHINMDMYIRWDTKAGNIWSENCVISQTRIVSWQLSSHVERRGSMIFFKLLQEREFSSCKSTSSNHWWWPLRLIPTTIRHRLKGKNSS